jgi:hypothetical protein
MPSKILYGIISTVIFLGIIGVLVSSNFSNEPAPSLTPSIEISPYEFDVQELIDSSLTQQTLLVEIKDKKLLFDFYLTPKDYPRIVEEKKDQLLDEVRIELKSEHSELLDVYGPSVGSVVIYPTFTSAAYSEPGFYTFFRDECDESCITDVSFANPSLGFTSSGIATQLLHLFDYDFISDVDVDKNPQILQKYDKLILLHNEYVTQKMFDAVTSHPNIVYLYPNALYAEIDVNYEDNTMTLIRGHNYPEPQIKNGFDYEVEERFHDYEYDTDCIDWEFIEFENGHALNCYPDLMIHTDLDILLKMKEF